MLNFSEVKNKLLSDDLSETMKEAIDLIGKNKKRPLGKFSPWAWGLEPTRGCNLKCWHCTAYMLPKNKYQFMNKKTWINLWKLIKELTPYCRVEMANTGEPTLHPNILEYIKMAQQISPNSQIQITTNGTTLIKNQITYKQLFDSGINIIYVDMYAGKEKHIPLAKKSGYDFFEYYSNKACAWPSPWTFHNDPKIQFIALSEIPDNWPLQKINRGGLGTFLNNINFDKIPKDGNTLFGEKLKFDIKPVINAPKRRCNQPMKYIQVMADGNYLMCCQDSMNEAKINENVNNGINGFFKFWLGPYMQQTRKILRNKDRPNHPICSRCNIIFSRCDMKLWNKELFDYCYDGKVLTKGDAKTRLI